MDWPDKLHPLPFLPKVYSVSSFEKFRGERLVPDHAAHDEHNIVSVFSCQIT